MFAVLLRLCRTLPAEPRRATAGQLGTRDKARRLPAPGAAQRECGFSPVILAPTDYARWIGEEPDPRDLMRSEQRPA